MTFIPSHWFYRSPRKNWIFQSGLPVPTYLPTLELRNIPWWRHLDENDVFSGNDVMIKIRPSTRRFSAAMGRLKWPRSPTRDENGRAHSYFGKKTAENGRFHGHPEKILNFSVLPVLSSPMGLTRGRGWWVKACNQLFGGFFDQVCMYTT